jgi:DNA-binding CsgD family transcriptional regulator
VGHRESEAIALNALGTSLSDSGAFEEGIEYLRESLAIAHEEGLDYEESGAWINIADVFHLGGRTREALETAAKGLDAIGIRDSRGSTFLRIAIFDYRFQLGDWTSAEAALPAASRRHVGGIYLYWQTARAKLALGRGDMEVAEEALAALGRATEELTEPQFVGPRGVLGAEFARRRGELDQARELIDDALDRIEYCSEDVVRIAALASTGLRVEGDAGQLARDRQDESAAQVARERAGALLERARLAAESGWEVERAQLALGEAEYARATRGESAELWAEATRRWEAVSRPYRAAYSRWREAEALMAARDRDGATRAASAALASARRLGSAWLVEEVESLAARARLQLGEVPERTAAAAARESENPFGLTARERDVLTLVAAGATNREIGERLHMAEKTASVHVSRILAKLNVRSRTEAAAVAHRQGMADTAPIG